MAIATKEELDKKIVEQDGEIAALKAKAEEVEKIKAEQAEAKKTMEEMRAKLAEVTSKNWAEKYSTNNGQTKEETLYNAGMWLKGVITKDKDLVEKYGKNSKYLNPSVEAEFGKGEFLVQKSKLGTPLYSDATTGSYLVPVEYAGEVMYVAKQASQLMGQVREIPMNGITKYVPTQNAAASCYWLTLQSSGKSETTPTFSRATLTSQTMGIYTSITEELEEDSLVNVMAYLRDIIGEAWGYEFDYQCTQSNANPFTGMLHGASNVYGMGAGQVAFSDLGFDDLYDAISELTTVNKRVGAKWIMHCTTFDIVRKIKDANGNYIYQQPQGTQPGTLCGYPYIITDGMNSASAADTKFIIFGNPKYFLFGNRLGLEFKVFDNTYYAATEDQIVLRARARASFTTAIGAAFVAVKTAAS